MDFESILATSEVRTHPVIKFDSYLSLDLSKDNEALKQIDLNSEWDFGAFIFGQIKQSQKTVGIGGYGEERSLYSRSDLFEGEEPRTIHLGVDIWCDAGTTVYCPMEGVVHSFANPNVHGDYGPVIILKHQIGLFSFHALYGHLAVSSLEGLVVGKQFQVGDKLASVGRYEENFHWPPHLHFQTMISMQGHIGDYPGVCKASEQDDFLANCPNPSRFIC